MKKIFNSRFFALIVLALVICTAFTSCTAPKAQTVSITDVTVAEDSTLTKDQLNAIATLVRNNTSAWSDFVAAYRGYDVLGDDANLSDYSATKEVNVEAAKKVLAKMAELRAIVDEVIAETGASSMKDMGKIMASIIPKTKGRADGKMINAIVKEKLS